MPGRAFTPEDLLARRRGRFRRLAQSALVLGLAPLAVGAGILGSFDRRQSPWVWPTGVVSLEGDGVVGRDYVLFNPGPRELRIRAQPSCGCTTVDAPKTIAPHSIGRASVSVDTATLPLGTSPKDVVVVADDGHTTRELKLYLNVTRKEKKP